MTHLVGALHFALIRVECVDHWLGGDRRLEEARDETSYERLESRYTATYYGGVNFDGAGSESANDENRTETGLLI